MRRLVDYDKIDVIMQVVDLLKFRGLAALCHHSCRCSAPTRNGYNFLSWILSGMFCLCFHGAYLDKIIKRILGYDLI